MSFWSDWQDYGKLLGVSSIANSYDGNGNYFDFDMSYIRPDAEIELNKVEIYSLLGKKLKEYNSNTTIYNIEDLSSGLYLIKIYSKKGMSTLKKLIKE